eukprot:scaffold293536_cov24-Tisochrysis_lutea.AAC.1
MRARQPQSARTKPSRQAPHAPVCPAHLLCRAGSAPSAAAWPTTRCLKGEVPSAPSAAWTLTLSQSEPGCVTRSDPFGPIVIGPPAASPAKASH